MKTTLTLVFLILFCNAQAQKVALFGGAIHKTRLKTLYYRFDDEQFSPKQSIPVQTSFAYGNKFENGYREEFDEEILRQHRYIYFSASLKPAGDSVLTAQNRLNLTELMLLIDSLPSREDIISICNDLFLDEHFDRLIKGKTALKEEDKKFAGHYAVGSNTTSGINNITLDSSGVYRSVCTDQVNNYFFLNEEVGKWTVGVFHYNSQQPALKVSQIYRFNSRVGNRSKPADVGSSFDILLKGERLLYPTGSEAYNELKRQ